MCKCDYISSFTFEDVSYGMYDTSGRIPIASELVVMCTPTHYINSHKKQHHTKIHYFVCVVYKQDTLQDDVEFQQRYREKPFSPGDACLTPFYQHVQ